MERHLSMIAPDFPRPRSWRLASREYLATVGQLGSTSTSNDNPWIKSKAEVSSLLIFGHDYGELADICLRYQSSQPKPNKTLDIALNMLLSTCELYKLFIDPTGNTPRPPLLSTLTAQRTAVSRTLQALHKACLSSKRTDWFPAFLSALLVICSAMAFTDAIAGVPSPAREDVWGDCRKLAMDLRNGGLVMIVSLLRAATKGVNPFKLDCFVDEVQGIDESLMKKKLKERIDLLGDDPPALEGILALKRWKSKYQASLEEGKMLFANAPYTLSEIRPIAGLFRVFEL